MGAARVKSNSNSPNIPVGDIHISVEASEETEDWVAAIANYRNLAYVVESNSNSPNIPVGDIHISVEASEETEDWVAATRNS